MRLSVARRTFTARPTVAALLFPLVVVAGGCDSTTEPRPPSESEALYASKVATLAIAVATAGSGTSFFDNVIPCARRGVISFHESTEGLRARIARFSGCDTGDGVVVDGVATIRGTPSAADPNRVTAVTLQGELSVTGPDGARELRTLTATNLSFLGTVPVVDGLVVAGVRVRTTGAEFPLDERGSPDRLFRPAGLSTGSLPNPGNSLDVLTEADLRRIALHSALILARVLVNETSEARPAHQHPAACGSLAVSASGQGVLPELTYDFDECDLGGGLLVSGDFSQSWTELDQNGGRMAMAAVGEIVLGGGTPRLALTRLEWAVSGVASLPAVATFSGRLVTTTGERRFSFTVPVDD